MIVMKFGGTSVEDASAIERASKIVQERLQKRPAVVVSALAEVTDALLQMSILAASRRIDEALNALHRLQRRHLHVLGALVDQQAEARALPALQFWFQSLQSTLHDISRAGELTERITAQLLGCGELLSSHIVRAAFQARGIDSVWVDSYQCIVTDTNYTNAVPQMQETAERLRTQVQPLILQDRVPVIPGFIGASSDGTRTTLGRGGSDFSASIVAASLNAARLEIWTDVDGMMTADPRLCPKAQQIECIGFEEASELAYFGAKVLHPATLLPLSSRNIPIYVLNSRDPAGNGTCISAGAPPSQTTFRAIAGKRGMTVLNVRSARKLGSNGFLRGVFEALERQGCVADLVSTSEVSVSVALQPSPSLQLLSTELAKLGEVEMEDGKAIICLVGNQIRGRVGVAARVFEAMAAAGINVHMISQGASEINIGFVIDEKELPKAIAQLHRRFFEEEWGILQEESPQCSAMLHRPSSSDPVPSPVEAR